MSGLRDYCEAMVKVREGMTPLGAYSCAEEFVLRHGDICEGQALPDGYERMTAKHCFGNARCLHLIHGLRYCEGYAMHAEGVIPVLHAWNLDEDGGVIDATWEDPADCTYFGVTLTADDLEDVKLGHSALDNWTEGWPLLQYERGVAR